MPGNSQGSVAQAASLLLDIQEKGEAIVAGAPKAYQPESLDRNFWQPFGGSGGVAAHFRSLAEQAIRHIGQAGLWSSLGVDSSEFSEAMESLCRELNWAATVLFPRPGANPETFELTLHHLRLALNKVSIALRPLRPWCLIAKAVASLPPNRATDEREKAVAIDAGDGPRRVGSNILYRGHRIELTDQLASLLEGALRSAEGWPFDDVRRALELSEEDDSGIRSRVSKLRTRLAKATKGLPFTFALHARRKRVWAEVRNREASDTK